MGIDETAAICTAVETSACASELLVSEHRRHCERAMKHGTRRAHHEECDVLLPGPHHEHRVTTTELRHDVRGESRARMGGPAQGGIEEMIDPV